MLRWKCNNCNLTWIYPVKKCIHCKGEIVKDRTSKMRVIGITEVTIPSPMHPIVPYNVLLLEDEHGNRMPRKTMEEYKIGDEFIERKAKTEGSVSIVKVKYDIYDAIEHALELINFNVKENSKILIKPSIIFPAYPYQAINTNPKTVDSIIKFLLSKNVNPENITVAEQSAYGINAEDAAAKAGILNICHKNNISFVDLAKTEFVERAIEDYKFKISKEVLNKDMIVNIPVLKTHSQLGIAGALENMIRVTDIETQKVMHKKNVDKEIAYLNKLLKYITIGDATIGLQGTGPLSIGEPAFLNLIIASNDAVALDRIFCEIGNFEVPDYIKISSDIGVGKGNLKEIEVVGNEIDAIKYSLNSANKNPSPHSNVNVIDGKSWSGDYITMYNVLSKLANIKTKGVNVVIGKIFEKNHLQDKEKIVAFGDTAIERLKEIGIKPIAEIKGDPPDVIESIILLKKILEANGELKISMIDKMKSKLASKVASIKR